MAVRRSHKTARPLLRAAEELGFSVAPTSGGHWRARHKTGAVVIFGGTPSDWRGVKNAVAMLRRTARQAEAAGGAR